jgi:hypothetical protein
MRLQGVTIILKGGFSIALAGAAEVAEGIEIGRRPTGEMADHRVLGHADDAVQTGFSPPGCGVLPKE